jgi:hypothetical protein
MENRVVDDNFRTRAPLALTLGLREGVRWLLLALTGEIHSSDWWADEDLEGSPPVWILLSASATPSTSPLGPSRKGTHNAETT